MNQDIIAPRRPLPGFRRVPRTGVIYVMHRANECGYGHDGQVWTNLGQGSPEVGVLEGAPARRDDFHLETREHSYGPVGGLEDLRSAVASFYNQLYRQNHSSKYTADNVSIAGGGRAAMTRLVASMAEVNLGHFIPDYTAYEELLGTFKGFVPIPILLDPRQNYKITAEQLEEEIVGRGLSAILCSNPSNPTGQVVAGQELADWIDVSRRCRSTFILDEFYSHYVYADPEQKGWSMVSAAEHVQDVDVDPVLLVDGLTKNWRYPGWRVSWILGPRAAIDQINSAGSFLDGGASHPFQRRAVELLTPELAIQETRAIHREFHAKRSFMSERLQAMGIRIDAEPQGAFYIWADLSELPMPLNDGMRFFEEALKYRVITVPGGFFDVNPGQRRAGTRFKTYSRFSFGPSMTSLEIGLDALERMVRSFS